MMTTIMTTTMLMVSMLFTIPAPEVRWDCSVCE